MGHACGHCLTHPLANTVAQMLLDRPVLSKFITLEAFVGKSERQNFLDLFDLLKPNMQSAKLVNY